MFCSYESCIQTYIVHTTSNGTKLLLEGLGYGIGRTNPFFFSYASIPFEDERIKKDVWPEIKPLTPYGQLPMLVADRRKVAQSTAICRYFAKQYDLAGKIDWANLHIDTTVDTIHDIRHKIAAFHYEEDEKVKAKRKAAEETLTFILERLDQQVKENDGYFYDGTLSWADLTFVALLDYLNFMYKFDLIENYENLKLLEKKVLLLPKIKNWIERRPVSEF
ncbi:glutathione S-transferase-like [Bombus huntii]|uniref:glutathione S-transferase-like n=1 Tax=Bombus huntii TaxID=85661 RepID=UPI0021AA3852|nr:glutathione S-transferase-like [Bombus huntii]